MWVKFDNFIPGMPATHENILVVMFYRGLEFCVCFVEENKIFTALFCFQKQQSPHISQAPVLTKM